MTPANKKFADFRENFTAYYQGCGEFKTVGIFAISLSVPKIHNILDFRFFLTVHVYLKTYFYENYTAKRTFYAEFRSIGIFEISFTVQKISMKAFSFF